MSAKTILFDAAKLCGADWNKPGNIELFNRAIEQAVRVAFDLPATAVPPSLAPPPVVAGGGRRASAACITLIHSFETCQLTTYRDPGSKNGLPITGGWGSTTDENGHPLQLGFTAPREYWDRLFLRDIAFFENGVTQRIGAAPTTQEQFDAFVSLAYNIGFGKGQKGEPGYVPGFGNSTLLRQHKAGDHEAAAAAFHSWRFNDGKEMAGLVRRRAAEAKLYRGQA